MRKKIKLSLTVLISFAGIILINFSGYNKAYSQTRGGVLRIIAGAGPRVLGYFPEMGPGDEASAFPAIERIMEPNANRELVPFLARDVKIDSKNLTFTIYLQKGVKFHDGSEMTADVVAWNYKLAGEGHKIQFYDQIRSIRVIDKYTLVLSIKGYNNQMEFAYGWVPVFSKASFEANGGKEWARANVVGTGPFKLVEWKRDAYLKWTKFDDYWQKGYPYLDGIEVRFIPDAMTASAMFQAKEGDLWAAPVKDQAELIKKGYKRQSYWAGLPSIIYLNTKNKNAPTAKLEVREAIEYALNKPAMAKALGYGFWTPLKMVAPPGEWGYDPRYKGREYNPAKARQLLSKAGYPNGCKLKLMALPEAGGRSTNAEAIKAFMDSAGFQVEVDIADPGRFFGSLFATGWDDMILFMCGTDFNFLATVEAWFGHAPKTNLASFERPEALLSLTRQAMRYRSKQSQRRATERIVRLIADQALMVPLFHVPAAYIIQPWVHTDYYKHGLIRWTQFDDWMEKH